MQYSVLYCVCAADCQSCAASVGSKTARLPRRQCVAARSPISARENRKTVMRYLRPLDNKRSALTNRRIKGAIQRSLQAKIGCLKNSKVFKESDFQVEVTCHSVASSRKVLMMTRACPTISRPASPKSKPNGECKDL